VPVRRTRTMALPSATASFRGQLDTRRALSYTY
jgi:hypothetical protein